MKTKSKVKEQVDEDIQERSLFSKILGFIGLRRLLILLFGLFMMIRFYVKSVLLSDNEKSLWTFFEDVKPELPSQNPLFYETKSQSESLPNRAKLMLKLTVFLFMVFLVLKRINSASQTNTRSK